MTSQHEHIDYENHNSGGLETITELCDFDTDSNTEGERVYLLMAIARKNENESLTHNTEVVFREVIRDETDIERKYNKVRAIATGYEPEEDDDLTFRVYMTVNARDTISTYFNYKEQMNHWLEQKFHGNNDVDRKFKKIGSHWKSELQKKENKADNKFIIDIDNPDAKKDVTEQVQEHTTIITEIRTPNGWHLVTEPFNYTELELTPEMDTEIKTDDMVFIDRLGAEPSTEQ